MCETATTTTAALGRVAVFRFFSSERAVIKKSLLRCMYDAHKVFIPFNSSHFGHIGIIPFSALFVCVCVALNEF